MMVNGYSAAFKVLIDHLAERGLIDREGLANALKDRAEAMQQDWADEYGPGAKRLDVSILRALSQNTVRREYPDPVQRGGDWPTPENDG